MHRNNIAHTRNKSHSNNIDEKEQINALKLTKKKKRLKKQWENKKEKQQSNPNLNNEIRTKRRSIWSWFFRAARLVVDVTSEAMRWVSKTLRKWLRTCQPVSFVVVIWSRRRQHRYLRSLLHRRLVLFLTRRKCN